MTDDDRPDGPALHPAPVQSPPVQSPAEEAGPYARPAGVTASFGEHDELGPPDSPRRQPPPGSRDLYGPPAGSPVAFDAAEQDRLPPLHRRPTTVAPELAAAFRPAPSTVGGYDAPPGSRIDPGAKTPASPWWKPDAADDPWRRADSPYWLGRAALFRNDQPMAVEDGEEAEQPQPAADEDGPVVVQAAGSRLRLLLSMLVIGLLAGGLGGGIGYWLTRTTGQNLHDADIKLAKVGTPANRNPGSVADIARRVGPAVVQIDVRGDNGSGTGSGVVIDKAGYILTNNHVVAAAGSGGTIRVDFSDETTETAQLVGRDPATDLAVLKVTHDALTVAALGDSGLLAVGDPVVAIGSPLGLQGTVTAGIVSALDRAVHVNGGGSDTDAVIDAIQTDAAINPGNSGGALVNADGSVVGIPSAIASLGEATGTQSGSIGLGFAIPVNAARQVAEQLIRTGKAVHASIGVRSRSVTDGTRLGAYILQIDPGGAAAKAGLKEGDVIKLVDTTLITGADSLIVAVNRHQPGDVVSVRFVRAGKELTVKVTLARDS